MKETKDLTAEDFKDRIGQSFLINNQPVTLEAMDTRDGPSAKMRTQVSLLFRADGELGVKDGQEPFSHPELGEHMLLVHRIVDPDGPAYEIILA
jgi:hypothetical protein